MTSRTLIAASLLAIATACSGSPPEAQETAKTAEAAETPKTLTNQDIAQLFTSYDADGDMNLKGKELDPIRAKLAEFDGNGDGEVALMEYTMAMAKVQAGAGPAPKPAAAP